MILIPAARPSRQPQCVAKANPLWRSRGMVALFDCRSAIEVISGARATVDAVPRALSVHGAAPDFSSSQIQFAHRAEYALTGAFTIAIFCDVDALSNYGALIAKQGTTTTNAPYELRLGSGSSDAQLNLVRASAGAFGSTTLAPGNVVSAGAKSARIVITADSATLSPSGAYYVNGSKTPYTGTGGAAPADNGADVWIGRRYDGATQLDGRIYHIALFNRVLTDAEANAFCDAPSSVFAPVRSSVPLGFDAGVAYVQPRILTSREAMRRASRW